MNKAEIGLVVILMGVLLYVSVSIYYDMVVELEEHPEIKEIGPPGINPDLRLMILTVVIAVIFCSIALKMKPKEEKKGDK